MQHPDASLAPLAPRWRALHAWALFDFGTTAFSMNVVSTYFALWVTRDHGASDLTYGLTKSVSMAIVIGIAPLLGALSDRWGTRRSFLIAATLLFVAMTFALGSVGPLWLGLVLYGLANIGFQLAGVFYNALLPALAPARLLGRVSGYGRALGYVGSLAAVFIGMAFATGKLLGHPIGLPAGGSQAVFVPTAVVILLACLPLLWVGAGAGDRPPAPAKVNLRHALAELRNDPALKGVALFIIGAFFFFDTVNTIRDFMSIYLVKVVGLSETGGSLQGFLAAVVLASLVGALGWGVLADRLGAKRALVGVLSMLAVGIAGLAFVTNAALVLHVIGPWLGLAFGGVLVTTRPLLVRLVPPDSQGLYFGLFVLANDVGAIMGPLSWGLVVKALAGYGALAYQAALLTQLLFLLVGLVCVLRVNEPALREA